MIIPFDFARL